MGKRLLFLTTWDFSDGPSTGITKKIKSQIKVFLKQGYEVDYTYISDNYVWIYEKGIRHKIGKTKIGRKFSANLYLANYFRDKRYDFVYNRYGLSDPFFLSLLKRLHENGCTIVVEIPTYPYDREKQSGLLWDILFKIDKIYRVKMNGVVDRIYTYSEDNQIWGIPTICSSNGIDFDLVSIRKACTDNASYHPGRCAKVYAGDVELGVFGQIHPLVAATYGVDAEIYAAELRFDALYSVRGGIPVYRPLPKFPAVTRDIAVVCAESVTVGALEDCIRRGAKGLLKKVELFDIYRGIGVAPGSKSVAFSLTLRADDRSLTGEEADEDVKSILALLEAELGAKLR